MLAAASAFARADRDVLVTPDGTLYKLEQATPSASAHIDAATFLSLAVQHGGDAPEYLSVPASLKSGYNFSGTLAYDAETKTLFVLWIHAPNAMTSEILLASYREGKWQPAISIDTQDYRFRNNLQLAITRRVSQLQKDGTYADTQALLLHALWWEESGHGEEARYALLTVDKGVPTVAEVHSLEEFIAPDTDTVNDVDATFNKDLLRHPAIVSSPSESSVNVVFGDTRTNTIHYTRFTPVADARVHIPVGIGGGGRGIKAPRGFADDFSGTVTVLAHGDNLLFANESEKGVSYLMYSDGKWSDVKSISTSDKLSAATALAAIERMLAAQ